MRASSRKPSLLFVVRSREEAERLLARARRTGVRLYLASPRLETASVGVAFFHRLGLELAHPIILDCGSHPGMVLDALRLGAGEIVYRGPSSLRARLDAMARSRGARVRGRFPCAVSRTLSLNSGKGYEGSGNSSPTDSVGADHAGDGTCQGDPRLV